jgi:hypothetical protein
MPRSFTDHVKRVNKRHGEGKCKLERSQEPESRNQEKEACRREGVRACGRVGVWACGRVGVWACGRVGEPVDEVDLVDGVGREEPGP